MRNMLQINILAIVCVSVLGCAPDVKRAPLIDNTPLLGPKQSDTLLKFNGDPKLSTKFPEIANQKILSYEALNTIETLWKLGPQLNQPRMIKLAQKIHAAIYASDQNLHTVSFQKSPYTDMVLSEFGPVIKDDLQQAIQKLNGQNRLIGALLDARTTAAPPQSQLPFERFTQMVRERLLEELAYLEAHSVDPNLIEIIRKALDREVLPILQRADPIIREILASSTLRQTLTNLERLFTIFEYAPTSEMRERFALGYDIAASIDNMRSEQAALTLIVRFWRMMSPQERLAHFYPNSAELYDYLKDKTPQELDCLASDSCLDMVIVVGKRKIFSGLREYGLTNLQSTFNAGANKFVLGLTEQTLPQEIAVIPQGMKKQILPRIETKIHELQNIRADLDGFVRTTLGEWTRKAISPSSQLLLTLSEKDQLRWSISGKANRIEVVADPQSNQEQFNAGTIGASFAFTSLRWDNPPFNPYSNQGNAPLMKNMLEQINRLILSYEERPSLKEKQLKKNFEAFTTGELLRGLSLFSAHLRDYESTLFDGHLGRVLIGDLNISDLPNNLSREPLFPKDSFFAMAIGTAALQLQALTTYPSPIFTVNTDDKIQWLDRAPENPSSPNIMAGVVDIIGGKRATFVESRSLARYLRGLVAFYKNTETLSLSRAPQLLAKSHDGRTNLEVILRGRDQVRDLIIGLANFLSHQIKADNAITLNSIHINGKVTRSESRIELEDQIECIEALMDSHELLQANMYLWSAIDTYYAMNKVLWNPRADFYFSNSQKEPATFHEKIATLHAIARLQEHLPPTSRNQAARILYVNGLAFQNL